MTTKKISDRQLNKFLDRLKAAIKKEDTFTIGVIVRMLENHGYRVIYED